MPKASEGKPLKLSTHASMSALRRIIENHRLSKGQDRVLMEVYLALLNLAITTSFINIDMYDEKS